MIIYLNSMQTHHDQTKRTILSQIETQQALAAALREREICAATAHGSSTLQIGEYFTPDDTEKLKKELIDYFQRSITSKLYAVKNS